jgi:hypothetical protein
MFRTDEYVVLVPWGVLIYLVELAGKVSLYETRRISGTFTLAHKSILEFAIEARAIKEEAQFIQ